MCVIYWEQFVLVTSFVGGSVLLVEYLMVGGRYIVNAIVKVNILTFVTFLMGGGANLRLRR